MFVYVLFVHCFSLYKHANHATTYPGFTFKSIHPLPSHCLTSDRPLVQVQSTLDRVLLEGICTEVIRITCTTTLSVSFNDVYSTAPSMLFIACAFISALGGSASADLFGHPYYHRF
ncbi:hypothetical protein BDR06DRAFT_415286 [Suillus hirtellus]|nr:hypothetical protein BDR06DRAFT_415286 [Suillus hirtellus]